MGDGSGWERTWCPCWTLESSTRTSVDLPKSSLFLVTEWLLQSSGQIKTSHENVLASYVEKSHSSRKTFAMSSNEEKIERRSKLLGYRKTRETEQECWNIMNIMRSSRRSSCAFLRRRVIGLHSNFRFNEGRHISLLPLEAPSQIQCVFHNPRRPDV